MFARHARVLARHGGWGLERNIKIKCIYVLHDASNFFFFFDEAAARGAGGQLTSLRPDLRPRRAYVPRETRNRETTEVGEKRLYDEKKKKKRKENRLFSDVFYVQSRNRGHRSLDIRRPSPVRSVQ